MSYILEALKKSERQRQREQGPSLQSIHTYQPAAQPQKDWRFGLLLVAITLCLVAGIYFYFASPSKNETETPPLLAEKKAVEQATFENNSLSNAETTGVRAEAGKGTDRDVNAAVSSADVNALIAESEAESVAAPKSTRIYELWELPENVRSKVPALTFSFHVFSTNPVKRTIIINNTRLREGSKVNGEIVLNEITEKGVILLVDGYRVFISVIEDW